jgi:hypothetical protein
MACTRPWPDTDDAEPHGARIPPAGPSGYALTLGHGKATPRPATPRHHAGRPNNMPPTPTSGAIPKDDRKHRGRCRQREQPVRVTACGAGSRSGPHLRPRRTVQRGQVPNSGWTRAEATRPPAQRGHQRPSGAEARPGRLEAPRRPETACQSPACWGRTGQCRSDRQRDEVDHAGAMPHHQRDVAANRIRACHEQPLLRWVAPAPSGIRA